MFELSHIVIIQTGPYAVWAADRLMAMPGTD